MLSENDDHQNDVIPKQPQKTLYGDKRLKFSSKFKGGDPDASSEENGGERPKDSAGFFASFLMGLFGEMSKMSTKASGSSSCSSCHEPWQERIFTMEQAGLLN